MMSEDAVDNDGRKVLAVLARLRKRRQRAQQDFVVRREQARRHQKKLKRSGDKLANVRAHAVHLLLYF